MKERILTIIADAVTDLIYYDRKEDDKLPVGAIELAVRDKVVTLDEMVDKFRNELESALK